MLLRHSSLYVLARLLAGAIAMSTTAVLTRLLAPAAYGRYGLALVIMSFGSLIFFDWIGVSLARLYQARREDSRTLSTFVQLYFLIAGGTVALTLVAWALGAFRGDSAAIYGIGIGLMWAYAWFELVAGFEVANFRPGAYLTMCLGRAAFILVGACGAAWLTGDPFWTAAGYGFGMVAASWLGGGRQWTLRPRAFDRDLALQICRFGLPLAFCIGLSGLATNGPRWLVNALDSAEALGFYTAAFVLVQNTLGVLAYGMVAAGYQLAIRAVESGNPAVAHRQLIANASLLFAVLAPASLGMALTGPGLAHTMVGSTYATEVARLTPWLAAAQFLSGIRSCYFDHAFQLGNKPYYLIWVVGAAAIVSIGMSVWLIPEMGSIGAAVALTIAMGISCVLGLVFGPRAYAMPIPYGAFARVLVACVAMSVVVVAVDRVGDGPIVFALQVSLGAVTYGIVALALNVLELRTPVWDFVCRPLSRSNPSIKTDSAVEGTVEPGG